jgi:urease accessory protein
MADRGDALLKLQSWLSPSFPTGAFSYSHGLEWAVEAGAVTDGASLRLWLEDILSIGSARNDAIIIAAIANAGKDADRIAEIAALALALAPSRERYLETVQQGASFRATIAQSWRMDGEAPDSDTPDTATLGPVAFPIAFGMAVAQHGIPIEEALPAYLNAFLTNLVSAAIRLGVIGQGEGQSILAGLLPKISLVAAEAGKQSLDDIASAALGVDFASLQHETQYSRLFRS